LDEALQQAYDFAIIATPSPHHIETATVLAKAGAHLFIEKPISDRLDGVDQVLAICRERQLTLLVGYPLRFNRPLKCVHAALQDRAIGRVLGFRAEVGQYLPDWRPQASYRDTVTARRNLGGGVLLELSHELDSARWLVGEVKAISAMATRISNLDIDVDDWADVNVQFASGAVGHIHLDMVQRTPTRGCRVIGSDGTITWDSATNHARLFSAATRQWDELHPPAAVDGNQMYLDELKHFLACVRGDNQPAVTGEDGKRALQIALAAQASARDGRTVEL
jgi:predicted dehydrogenase